LWTDTGLIVPGAVNTIDIAVVVRASVSNGTAATVIAVRG